MEPGAYLVYRQRRYQPRRPQAVRYQDWSQAELHALLDDVPDPAAPRPGPWLVSRTVVTERRAAGMLLQAAVILLLFAGLLLALGGGR